eukprot:312749-Amphidinium_carterae.2
MALPASHHASFDRGFCGHLVHPCDRALASPVQNASTVVRFHLLHLNSGVISQLQVWTIELFL